MSDNHRNALKTAWNEHTGDFIKNSKGSQDKYAQGWDAIFGKKKEEPLAHAYEVTPEIVDGREQLHPYTLEVNLPNGFEGDPYTMYAVSYDENGEEVYTRMEVPRQ